MFYNYSGVVFFEFINHDFNFFCTEEDLKVKFNLAFFGVYILSSKTQK